MGIPRLVPPSDTVPILSDKPYAVHMVIKSMYRALSDDRSLVLSTLVVTPVPGDLMPSFGLCGLLHAHGAHNSCRLTYT